ncbi:hypothetical protein RJ640_015457 [Escallonia rubra]|uniref:Chlororespiratory reduction 42 n=1 Tax=Escallonia rubra TaxID=112253 RepID=A0AA88QG07_9ASTE|nr:hypothetical protein RJ640_015457 [Escallonia rubra]
MAAPSLSSVPPYPSCSRRPPPPAAAASSYTWLLQFQCRFTTAQVRNQGVVTSCVLRDDSPPADMGPAKGPRLGIGSPIVVIEAPKVLKTAASVPCLRANSGLVKPGDVGRIVSRKPKDVWAVRLTIGTYLIDGKYFKALDLSE